MLGDTERHLLHKLAIAADALRDARAEALAMKKDNIVIELRIVAIALLAVQQGIKDELPEYRNNDQ